MSRPTREQIEEMRAALQYWAQFPIGQIDALCDMALRSDLDAIIEKCAPITDVECTFQHRADLGYAIPKVIVSFAKDDWVGRDAFARFILGRAFQSLKTPKEPTDDEPYFYLRGYRKRWRSYSHFNGNVISYDDAVEWSGIDSDREVIRERIYTITYSMPHGSSSKDGSLLKGQSVPFESGMVFNISRTEKA